MNASIPTGSRESPLPSGLGSESVSYVARTAKMHPPIMAAITPQRAGRGDRSAELFRNEPITFP